MSVIKGWKIGIVALLIAAAWSLAGSSAQATWLRGHRSHGSHGGHYAGYGSYGGSYGSWGSYGGSSISVSYGGWGSHGGGRYRHAGHRLLSRFHGSHGGYGSYGSAGYAPYATASYGSSGSYSSSGYGSSGGSHVSSYGSSGSGYVPYSAGYGGWESYPPTGPATVMGDEGYEAENGANRGAVDTGRTDVRRRELRDRELPDEDMNRDGDVDDRSDVPERPAPDADLDRPQSAPNDERSNDAGDEARPASDRRRGDEPRTTPAPNAEDPERSVSTDGPQLFDPGMQTGFLNLRLPAEAKVFVNGVATSTPGAERQFTTHSLRLGETCTYKIRAQIDRGGRTLTEDRVVTLGAGDSVDLALSFSGSAPAVRTASAR